MLRECDLHSLGVPLYISFCYLIHPSLPSSSLSSSTIIVIREQSSANSEYTDWLSHNITMEFFLSSLKKKINSLLFLNGESLLNRWLIYTIYLPTPPPQRCQGSLRRGVTHWLESRSTAWGIVAPNMVWTTDTIILCYIVNGLNAGVSVVCLAQSSGRG